MYVTSGSREGVSIDREERGLTGDTEKEERRPEVGGRLHITSRRSQPSQQVEVDRTEVRPLGLATWRSRIISSSSFSGAVRSESLDRRERMEIS